MRLQGSELPELGCGCAREGCLGEPQTRTWWWGQLGRPGRASGTHLASESGAPGVHWLKEVWQRVEVERDSGNKGQKHGALRGEICRGPGGVAGIGVLVRKAAAVLYGGPAVTTAN